MGEVVNLRLARKQRRRTEAETQAEINRAAHGRTKAERRRTRQDIAQADRHLDGHRRDDAT